MKLLAETEGIFAETAGGVVVAALKHQVATGAIRKEDLTVVFITGAGFKTLEAVAETVVRPVLVKPTVSSVEEALRLGVMAGGAEMGTLGRRGD